MFGKLKKSIDERIKEQEKLKAYENKLRAEAEVKQKTLSLQAKKRALEEKYSKLNERYSKTPAERRKESVEKFKKAYGSFKSGTGDSAWGQLGRMSENATNNLYNDPFSKPRPSAAPKRKMYGARTSSKKQSNTNPYLDKFLKGEF